MATTSDYLNKLIAQKNALADNLVTKGVTASHDETLEALVPKVLNINGGSSSPTIDGDLSYANYKNQVANIVLGLIGNVKEPNCGYNMYSDHERDRLLLYKTDIGYNLTRTYAIDFTGINKIIIYGSMKSNLSNLTSTAYYYLNSEISSELDDNWTMFLQNVGNTDLIDFVQEIDCSTISGNNYLHLAIKHGTEISGYTSYLYIDKIEFL